MTESEPDRNRDRRVPPPASTEWSQHAAEEGGDLPLPPFFAGAEEPVSSTGPEPAADASAMAEPWDTGTSVEEPAEEDSAFPFEDMDAPVERSYRPAEPAPEQPVAPFTDVPISDMEAAPATEATPAVEEPVDDFPVEAFHLPRPEDAGEMEPAFPATERAGMRAHELADRLDRLAEALRSRGTAALTDQLAGGDRFDALLTGLLAGFLAAGDD
jgi:hypothetical protein